MTPREAYEMLRYRGKGEGTHDALLRLHLLEVSRPAPYLADECELMADAIDDGAEGWEKESYDVPHLRLLAKRARALAAHLRGTP